LISFPLIVGRAMWIVRLGSDPDVLKTSMPAPLPLALPASTWLPEMVVFWIVRLDVDVSSLTT